MGQWWHCKIRNYIVFYGKINKNHQLGKGFFFVHQKIVSAVKRVESVSDRDVIYSSERSLV